MMRIILTLRDTRFRTRKALGGLVLLAVGPLFGLGCGSFGSSSGAGDGRLDVVAGFFPLAEAAREIGGAAVRVTDLTPAGAEPHDLELNPKQVDALERADLIAVMGHKFQPAVEEVAARRKSATLVVLDALDISEGSTDPHVWLDPTLMSRVVAVVETRLIAADPEGRASYEAGAARTQRELATLDDEYRRGLATCTRRTVVTAHEAFGYLAARYDLTQQAIAGIDPTQEPNADRLGELADLARREHVTTIFTETLVSPRVADAVAREAGGLRTEVLDPIESAHGGSYLERMRTNLTALRKALDCT